MKFLALALLVSTSAFAKVNNSTCSGEGYTLTASEDDQTGLVQLNLTAPNGRLVAQTTAQEWTQYIDIPRAVSKESAHWDTDDLKVTVTYDLLHPSKSNPAVITLADGTSLNLACSQN